MLTRREEKIMDLVCEGAANKDIAYRLGISEQTVKNYTEGYSENH